MKFMNYYDIDHAVSRFTQASKPNRLGAALVIRQLADWADNHSDGWCYWPKPVRAASRLMELCESRTSEENRAQEETDCTDAELQAAARPVKSFLTRAGASADDRERILRALA